MKTFINIPLLIEQCKRFWVIPALSMLVYVLAIVVPMYAADPTGWNTAARMITMVLSMNHPVMITAMVLVPLAAAMALFPYHFNGVANTAFTAFPVNKKQLFFTNLAAGALMFIVPLFLLSLLLLIPITSPATITLGEGYVASFSHPSRFNPHLTQHIWGNFVRRGQILNSFPIVAAFFGRSVLGFGLYFALGVLAVSITGSRVIAALVAGIVAFLPAIVLGTIAVIFDFYVFGSSGHGMFFLDEVLYFMHPVTMGSILTQSWRANHLTVGGMWPYYLSYFLVMAGMFGVGAFACLRRAAERAGETIAFTPIKNVLVFIMSLAGMVISGVFFMTMMQGSRFGYYLGFVLGFVIIYFLAQMIAEKTFHVWHKVRKLGIFGGTALGLYLLMLGITHGAMFGFVTRVPQAGDIAGVYIWHDWPSPHNATEGTDFKFITDRQIIARTMGVHEEIIAARGNLRSYMWASVTTGRVPATDLFPISYRLQNGRTIHRTYRLPHGFMRSSGIEYLIREEAVTFSRHPELLDPSRILSLHMRVPHQFATRYNLPVPILVGGNYAIHTSLMEAIRRDVAISAVNNRRRSLNELHWITHSSLSIDINLDYMAVAENFRLEHVRVYEPIMMIEGTVRASAWQNQTLRRFLNINDFTYTLAWLREHYARE
ncbi:MAG: hypothetical protein FWB88_02810 [Defluviitaleaceae bacterium]|nr:hypothetical protein [Defluviitaleaceae bacterium]MCL2238561.1 hypothetical protein [Defluviitaleaceae bacterium]